MHQDNFSFFHVKIFVSCPKLVLKDPSLQLIGVVVELIHQPEGEANYRCEYEEHKNRVDSLRPGVPGNVCSVDHTADH